MGKLQKTADQRLLTAVCLVEVFDLAVGAGAGRLKSVPRSLQWRLGALSRVWGVAPTQIGASALFRLGQDRIGGMQLVSDQPDQILLILPPLEMARFAADGVQGSFARALWACFGESSARPCWGTKTPCPTPAAEPLFLNMIERRRLRAIAEALGTSDEHAAAVLARSWLCK